MSIIACCLADRGASDGGAGWGSDNSDPGLADSSTDACTSDRSSNGKICCIMNWSSAGGSP